MLPLLALAVVSFVFVRGESGWGQGLITLQHQAQVLTTSGVDRVVRFAPDPVENKAAASAVCRSLGSGALRNPWSCVLRYRSGRVIQYRVRLAANGTYFGDQEIIQFHGVRSRDTGTIRGCCVTIS
jgi:hypothetical protein